MKSKTYAVAIFITILASYEIAHSANLNVSVDANLNISIPCVDVSGSYYEATLNLYNNPSESGYFWMLAGALQGVKNNLCATTDSNFNISIPSADVGGVTYKVELKYYDNPNQSTGMFWYLGPIGPADTQNSSTCSASSMESCLSKSDCNGVGGDWDPNEERCGIRATCESAAGCHRQLTQISPLTVFANAANPSTKSPIPQVNVPESWQKLLLNNRSQRWE